MGTILNELLNETSKSEFDEQLKIICDKIMEEEINSFKNPDEKPKGANIFLSIQFYNKLNEINFLCLEREMRKTYIISIWSKRKISSKNSIARRKSFEVTEYKIEKILNKFAEILKDLKGE